MKYIKELDSIRAFAVLFVLICHWIPANEFFTDFRLGMFGAVGVDIFFVLSGFLISGILLTNKMDVDDGKMKKTDALKYFYIRRAIRIFPIFYLLLLGLMIFKMIIPELFLYSATYTVNFYFFMRAYYEGNVIHLWSLAVEEQFYLIWPLLLLFINTRHIKNAIIVFIIIGITSQYLVMQNEFGFLLTNTCFDAFGLGALLAFLVKFRPGKIANLYKFLLVVAPLTLVVIIFEFFYGRFLPLPQRTLHSIVALWVITYILQVKKVGASWPFKLFYNQALIFMGKISYGIYIYHLVVPQVRDFLFPGLAHYQTFQPFATVIFFVINFLLVFVMAYLSFRFIEKPLLKLKKYFTYPDSFAIKSPANIQVGQA